MGKKKWEHQVDRTPAELLDDLCTQLKLLWDACKQYDAGNGIYGVQIAVKLRVLLHQTTQSESLLRQASRRFAFSCPDFLSLSTVRGEMVNKGKTDFVRSPLIQYRMVKATELLKLTRLSVQDIASAVGYSNPLHFSRAFKKVYGKSPRVWRSEHQTGT